MARGGGGNVLRGGNLDAEAALRPPAKSGNTGKIFPGRLVDQGRLATKGGNSIESFFARLAAFFSFGVCAACFFASLLGRWGWDMVFTPVHIEGMPVERGRRS